MTLKKNENLDEEYEEYPPLTIEHFRGEKELKLKIHEEKAPKIVKTKFREEQPLVFVQIGIESFCWWANWRSMNKLIDLYGINENMHRNKEITLTWVEQAIKGDMRQVIYLKDSIKKKSKKG